MNRPRPPAAAATAAVAILLATSQYASAAGEDSARGDRVTRVVIEGALQVEIEQAATTAVHVSEDSTCSRAVTWTIREQTLTVAANDARCTAAARVQVEVRTLSDLAVRGPAEVALSDLRTKRLTVMAEGSGDIAIDGLECEDFVLIATGSGDVTADGRAERQRHELRGDGDIDAANLVGADVDVLSSGAGDIHVHATHTLSIRSTGSGDVRYSGRPTVTPWNGAGVARAD